VTQRSAKEERDFNDQKRDADCAGPVSTRPAINTVKNYAGRDRFFPWSKSEVTRRKAINSLRVRNAFGFVSLKLIVLAAIDMFKSLLSRYPVTLYPEGRAMKTISAAHMTWLLSIAVFPALFLIAGCSQGGVPKPKTVPVSGKVLYKGQPVDGATVAFLGDGTIPPALGKTDSLGRFQLTTSEPGDGAVAGMHQVTVTKIVGSPASKEVAGPMSMEDALKRGEQKTEDAGPLSLLPEKYAKAGTSGLSFEVKPSGTNDFPIELKD
jgi:hypothetical protein